MVIPYGANMALLQRLFPRKNSRITRPKLTPTETKSCADLPKLDRNKIRLVVYCDHDRGRTPLFDSSAIKRVEDIPEQPSCRLKCKSQKTSASHGSPASLKGSQKFHLERLGSDVKMLEEMMFGSVAMAFKGNTIKVHFIRSPPQLMLTKVFVPEKAKQDSGGEIDDSISLPGHSGDFSTPRHITPSQKEEADIAHSIPVDVPMHHRDSLSSCDDDSGLASFTSSGSFHSSGHQYPSPSPGGSCPSSYNSLHRRWMRAQTKMLDSCAKKLGSSECLTQALNNSSAMPRKRKSKIALAVLFGPQDEKDEVGNKLFQDFFFSHVALFEGHMEKLSAVVERAFFNKRNFLPTVVDALEVFRNDIHDLYTAPRLSEPVWLGMMSGTSHRFKLCERFLDDFMRLVDRYDSKSTSFFVSTLLSAVLTHHLAWVPTVTPHGGTASRHYLDKHSPKWVDALTKNHPYNPLWAQLGDLHGSLTLPMKLSRTVIVGKKADIVKRFLFVLSYFIRCSDVHEVKEFGSLKAFMESLTFDLPIASSQKASGVQEDSSSSVTSAGSMDTVRCAVQALQERRELEAAGREQGKKAVGGCVELIGMSDRSAAVKSASDCEEPQQNPAASPAEGGGSGDETKSVPCKENPSSPCPSCDGRHCDGACSSSAPGGAKACVASVTDFIRATRVENVQHVRRSVDPSLAARSLSSEALPVDTAPKPLESAPVLRKSALTLQLEKEEAEKEAKACREAARKRFLDGGSNSMFEEYFSEDIETKTIDDVAEQDRVIDHPLTRSSESLTRSGESSGARSTPVQRQSSQTDLSSSSRHPSFSLKHKPSLSRETSRQRHLSSTSSIDPDLFDPLVHCKEIPMPRMTTENSAPVSTNFERNFGRSLFGGYSDHYMSDFILHGTSDTNFLPKLQNDLQIATQHPVLDEYISEAICVVANTDDWSVKQVSSRLLESTPTGQTPWTTSQMVCSMLEAVLHLWKLRMSPESCLMHLEDCLQEIYLKSRILAEHLKYSKKTNMRELAEMLGFDASDYPLLVSVAQTHTPLY